ncbi:hypothetical protein FUA48_10535 [Flavobacterium alkalisoli]|uniref:PH domain-containing protein n=1 Tax=Flavobacterium alkalisoli TaxID=2602769 RepID=A0A5B9FSK4_9FLAO|nr:hypothetical protein [Flavobacterium alkalisoli]QEE50000.1 hypothetical protein FUA48_10535 [Flavobacterium alkalisoli]
MTERKFNFYSNKKKYITTPLRKIFLIFFVTGLVPLSLIFFEDLVLAVQVLLMSLGIGISFFLIAIVLPTLLIYYNHKKFNEDSTFNIRLSTGEYYYSDKSGELIFRDRDIKKVVLFLPYALYKHSFAQNSVWNQMFYTLIILKTGERIVLSCLIFNQVNIYPDTYKYFPEASLTSSWKVIRQQVTFPNVKKGLAPASNNNLDKHTPIPEA